MAPKCKPDVALARAQTERVIAQAEKVMTSPASELSGSKPKRYASTPAGQRSWDHCKVRLEGARAAFQAAGEIPDPIKQRDAYIHAGFQAGQALVCVRTAKIGTKMGTPPKPPPPKPPKLTKKKAPEGEE